MRVPAYSPAWRERQEFAQRRGWSPTMRTAWTCLDPSTLLRAFLVFLVLVLSGLHHFRRRATVFRVVDGAEDLPALFAVTQEVDAAQALEIGGETVEVRDGRPARDDDREVAAHVERVHLERPGWTRILAAEVVFEPAFE